MRLVKMDKKILRTCFAGREKKAKGKLFKQQSLLSNLWELGREEEKRMRG